MPYQPELYAQDQVYGQFQHAQAQQAPVQHRPVQQTHADQRLYNGHGDPGLHFPGVPQSPQSYLPQQQQQQQLPSQQPQPQAYQLQQPFYNYPPAPQHAAFGNQQPVYHQPQYHQQGPGVTPPQVFAAAPQPLQPLYQQQGMYSNATNSPYIQTRAPPPQSPQTNPGYQGQLPPRVQHQELRAGNSTDSHLPQYQQMPAQTSPLMQGHPLQAQIVNQRQALVPEAAQRPQQPANRYPQPMSGHTSQNYGHSMAPGRSPSMSSAPQALQQRSNVHAKTSYVPVVDSPQQSRLQNGSSANPQHSQVSPQVRPTIASAPKNDSRETSAANVNQNTQHASPQGAIRKSNENTPVAQPPKKKVKSPYQNGSAVEMPRIVAEVRIPTVNSTPQKVARPADGSSQISEKPRRPSAGQSTLNRPKSKQLQATPPQMQSSLPPISSPLTELNSSQFPPTPQPPPIDNQAVLLHLADEYIASAHKIGGLVATPSSNELQIDTYQSLMATAMGCLESVLKNYRFADPRKEARLRLRLASLMLDETDNHQETGDVLDKGIALCERSKLVDLKYAMQHLSVRVLHATNPQAALRALDKLINETTLMKLQHWVYAFRFLRVSLSLASFTHTDTIPLLKNLQTICDNADRERRPAIVIIASIMEAMVHLKSGSSDTVEHAQRALAKARTHQLSQAMEQMPQVPSLLDCVEIACHTLQFNPELVQSKLHHLHQSMDQSSRDAGWAADGSIWVSLGMIASKDIEADAAGIMKTLKDGNTALVLKWLTRNQAYILSYLLSGVVHGHKGNGDGRCEPYLMEGLKLCDALPTDTPQSLVSARAMVDWQMCKRIASRLQLIFDYCGRSDWDKASAAIQDFHRYLPLAGSQPDPGATTLLMYLGATCKQGQGELDAAYATYKRPELTFDPNGKGITADRDIRVLATLNSVLILRCINQHDQILADMLVHSVEDYCLKHHNKAILAAFYIIKTTSEEPDGMILKTKQHLQSAVQAARTSGSNQLLCIVMSLMSSLYFTNIVGDQAEKSVSASRSLAKKSHSDLWLAVTDSMLADTCELMGKHENARLARDEAADVYAKIPELVKNRIKTMYDDL